MEDNMFYSAKRTIHKATERARHASEATKILAAIVSNVAIFTLGLEALKRHEIEQKAHLVRIVSDKKGVYDTFTNVKVDFTR